MDYTFPASNPSSCGSSAVAGEPEREKSKKNTGGDGGRKRSKGTVKLSTDPQSVAARERRHRISDRFKILQSLVPGGTKMDTVSMLDEAIHYVKFLKTQILLHQTIIDFVDFDHPSNSSAAVSAAAAADVNYSGLSLDQIAAGEVNNFIFPENDVVKMEDHLNEVNYNFPSEQEQFLCSYDANYINF